jgi:hypothetical protein
MRLTPPRSCIPLIALLAWSGPAAGFEPATYLPLGQCSSWTYDVDQILPEQAEFGGEPVWLLKPVGEGFLHLGEYFTNDALGLRYHGVLVEIEGLVIPVELDPPILLSPASTPISTTHGSEGTATFRVGGTNDPVLDYEATSRLLPEQQVTVPAGTFDAIQLELDFEISGELAGQQVSIDGGGTWWLADGVGKVRSFETVAGDELQTQLVSYDCPEPTAAVSATAVLLVFARRAVRRARLAPGCSIETMRVG